MIHYQFSDRVARITLDRPEAGNRINYQMMLDLIAAFECAAADKAIVLVLDAKGEDFTWGRDQKEALPKEVSRLDSLGLILRANAALRDFPGISIALVKGHALGFGSGLALHATFSLGADTAVLGFDEIAHGLAPLVVVAYLPHFIGARLATDLVYTGRKLAAEEAAKIGLLTRVVPADRLEADGEALINELLQKPAGALRLIRSFEKGLPTQYPDARISAEAISRLDAWLGAGRPEFI